MVVLFLAAAVFILLCELNAFRPHVTVREGSLSSATSILRRSANRRSSGYSALGATGPLGAADSSAKLWPIDDGPVLTVKEKNSNCTIHLVGVSHGSPASSALVSKVMREVNPSSVVVELCEDRFVSISLDASIRPRGNATLGSIYDEKMKLLKQMKESKKAVKAMADGEIPLMTRMRSAWAFARGQGAVGGVFVLLGLTVSALQKLSQVGNRASETVCDEFVTAMREAETLNVPVVLGDAAQNDTLKSIKTVLSPAMFDPATASQGALFLAFSAFGVYPRESYELLSSKIDDDVLQASEWVSIPRTYARSKALLRSLGPFFALATLTAVLGYLPELSEWPTFSVSADVAAATDSTSTTLLAAAATADSGGGGGGGLADSPFAAALSQELPIWLRQSADLAADAFSFLLLVRLGKIIGTDRDKIIAANVRQTALASPNQELVVVVGMLHCNGVGRWLLSGVDPFVFEEEVGTVP